MPICIWWIQIPVFLSVTSSGRKWLSWKVWSWTRRLPIHTGQRNGIISYRERRPNFSRRLFPKGDLIPRIMERRKSGSWLPRWITGKTLGITRFIFPRERSWITMSPILSGWWLKDSRMTAWMICCSGCNTVTRNRPGVIVWNERRVFTGTWVMLTVIVICWMVLFGRTVHPCSGGKKDSGIWALSVSVGISITRNLCWGRILSASWSSGFHGDLPEAWISRLTREPRRTSIKRTDGTLILSLPRWWGWGTRHWSGSKRKNGIMVWIWDCSMDGWRRTLIITGRPRMI